MRNMYSEVLLLVLGACIISLCEAGLVGDYNELILAVRSPVSSFFEYQNKLQSEAVGSANVIAYFREYSMIFEANTWIIHGLNSTKYGHTLTKCHDRRGELLTYGPSSLPQMFKDELKKKWPIFSSSQTLDEFWGLHYNNYGSCINDIPMDYFGNAIALLEAKPIEEILRKSKIFPGTYHKLNDITTSITYGLGTRPLVICLPNEISQSGKQYLLEVQICFNRGHQLMHCRHSTPDLCVTEKNVTYPGWPRNEKELSF